MQAQAQLAQGKCLPAKFCGICLALAAHATSTRLCHGCDRRTPALPPTRSYLFGRGRVRAQRRSGCSYASGEGPQHSTTTIEGEWQEVATIRNCLPAAYARRTPLNQSAAPLSLLTGGVEIAGIVITTSTKPLAVRSIRERSEQRRKTLAPLRRRIRKDTFSNKQEATIN